MKVRDVMNEQIERVDPEATIRDAADTLKKSRCGSLWVIEGNRAAGAVTDATMTTVVARRQDPDSTLVRDVMEEDVCLLPEEQPLSDASAMLDEHRASAALVVAEGGRFVGTLLRAELPTPGSTSSGQVMGFKNT
jgi:CBS domain-containing protein